MIDIWDISGTRKLYHTYIIKKPLVGVGVAWQIKELANPHNQSSILESACKVKTQCIHNPTLLEQDRGREKCLESLKPAAWSVQHSSQKKQLCLI